jgi:hypothetical protein
MRLTDWHGSITHHSCSCLARNLPRYMPTTMDHAPPARQPLPQPHDRIPPVVPQGVRSVPSPGYGRYVTATLSFVAGMLIGARRRARYP